MLQNFSPEDLVGEEQWLEGESTFIQCAYGDAIAYPLAVIELKIQGKSVLVNAAVSDTLCRQKVL